MVAVVPADYLSLFGVDPAFFEVVALLLLLKCGRHLSCAAVEVNGNCYD